MTQEKKNIFEKLLTIQSKLNVPKNRYSEFGNYHYRNTDDILTAIKPLLIETNTTLMLEDDIVSINEKTYVKATATLQDNESEKYVKTTAFAREISDKKKMDEAQMTGSTSSYARKYALNGLLILDDNIDSDALRDIEAKQTQNRAKTSSKADTQYKQQGDKVISEKQATRLYTIANGHNDIAKKVMSAYGYKSSKEILAKDYNNICSEIEANIRMKNELGE